MDREEPGVVEAIDQVVAAARERGLAAGIFAGTPEYASRMVEKGFRFVNVSSDARLMSSAATAAIADIRGE
jgi:4-hydroxy-2-oxoheptanedioate aldolase